MAVGAGHARDLHGIAAIFIAGKARSYGTKPSLFVVPACGDGG